MMMPSPARSRTLLAATLAFFAAILVIGVLVYDDYGMSWDEIPTREFGVMNVTHAVPNVAVLDSLRAVKGPAYERFGPVFEILLVRVERALRLYDLRAAFLMRHLVTFLVFYLGVVLFFFLCRRRFGGGIALLASVCLVASPQLFSHAFYNVKDISFLTCFVAAMLTLDSVLANPTWRTVLLHGVVTGVLIGTRILGLFAMMLTAAAALAKRPTLRTLGLLVGYGVVVVVMLPLVWPVLRIDPIGIVKDAVLGATTNPYLKTNLFRGQALPAASLPWDYVPTWILITTPYVVSALFVVGVAAAVRSMRALRAGVSQNLLRDLLAMSWFFLPVLGCVVLRPVMYDSWRHLFFVYPAMVYLAAIGMEAVLTFAMARFGETKLTRVRVALTSALLACLAPVIWFMVANHPFEHLYFNRFAGRDMQQVKQRFELDYWGLSYRKALEYVVASDPAPNIRIIVANYPGRVNVLMLAPRDRARITIVGPEEGANYFITNYRFHPEPYPFANEVFSVRVGNASIVSVFGAVPQ